MIAAAVFIASGCEEFPLDPNPSPDDSSLKLSIRPSISNYTKATDTEFENGDAISLSIVTPTALFLDNCKFTYNQGEWTAEKDVVWYSENVPSVVTAIYPATKASMKDYYPLGNSPIEFTVQSDQATHAGYTGSDLMLATKEGVYPSEEAVSLTFKHLLSKVVINVKSEVDGTIEAVYLSGVYGKGVISQTYEVAGEKASIKAVALASPNSGYTHSFQVIVPPQTSKPMLIVSMEGGKAYEYELPEEVVFSSGKVRTAEITITPESISAEFNADILNWTSDAELNFSQPQQPENPDDPADNPDDPGNDDPKWVSLGYGRFVESFLAPFVDTSEEWMVEFEQNTETLELYRLKNPYTNEYSPYKEYATSEEDSYIYFHVLVNGRVYVEDGPIGLTIDNYGEIYGGSLCPENAWDDYYEYGQLIENGNLKYIYFPARSIFCRFDYQGETFITYGLRHNSGVFTFPDKERDEFMKLSNGIEVIDDESENITCFQMYTGIDMPENWLKFTVLEGVHQSDIWTIAENMLSGEQESTSLPNKKGIWNVLTQLSLPTGTYTAIVAYKSVNSNNFYCYYKVFSHLVPGEEAPSVSIGEIGISLDPTAPEYCADVKIVAPGTRRLGCAIIDDQTFSTLGNDKETMIEFVKSNGKFTAADFLIDKEYLTRFENELEPDTHYNYLVYVENAYGNSDFKYADFTTGKEDDSKWSILPEKGEYFDNLWNRGYAYEPFFSMPPAEVTIMQYGTLPRYKVLQPYQEYWTGMEGGDTYLSLPDRDKDIEFWIKDFDYFGTQTKGIYFRPFSTGAVYPGSDYPCYLMSYSYFTKNSHPNGCTSYTDDVFHLNGWLEVFGGREPRMGYQFYGQNDHFVVSLRKGAYANQSMAASMSSWKSPMKLPERLTEKSYLETCKSYAPQQVRTSNRNKNLSLNENVQRIK